MTDGVFLMCVEAVASDFPDVAYDDMLVDASTAHLVPNPEQFDVIVATNFYGDIISDLACELSGGLGLAGSANASDTHCYAQAQHGSAPDIVGKSIANLTSMILSCAMLLNWMSTKQDEPALAAAATAIDDAVDNVLEQSETRTPDPGGKPGTDQFAGKVAEVVRAEM